MSNTPQTSPSGKWHEWTRGDRLRVARESVTPSQADFAEITGIGRNTISRYENNFPAKPIYVRQWALATGFSFEWLMFGRIPDAPVPGPVTQGYLRRNLVTLKSAA